MTSSMVSRLMADKMWSHFEKNEIDIINSCLEEVESYSSTEDFEKVVYDVSGAVRWGIVNTSIDTDCDEYELNTLHMRVKKLSSNLKDQILSSLVMDEDSITNKSRQLLQSLSSEQSIKNREFTQYHRENDGFVGNFVLEYLSQRDITGEDIEEIIKARSTIVGNAHIDMEMLETVIDNDTIDDSLKTLIMKYLMIKILASQDAKAICDTLERFSFTPKDEAIKRIIELGDPSAIYRVALLDDVPLDELAHAIISTNDIEWIERFLSNVPNLDGQSIVKLIDRLLKLGVIVDAKESVKIDWTLADYMESVADDGYLVDKLAHRIMKRGPKAVKAPAEDIPTSVVMELARLTMSKRDETVKNRVQ